MNAPAILDALRAAGLTLSLTTEYAVKVAPASRLNDDLRKMIRTHRAELRDWLTAAANGPQPDLDRDCWPNDPATDAAMNTAEIMLFVRRHARLLALGLTDGEADKLADRLKMRDRESDARRSCAECRYARSSICKGGRPLPVALLHQCEEWDDALG